MLALVPCNIVTGTDVVETGCALALYLFVGIGIVVNIKASLGFAPIRKEAVEECQTRQHVGLSTRSAAKGKGEGKIRELMRAQSHKSNARIRCIMENLHDFSVWRQSNNMD